MLTYEGHELEASGLSGGHGRILYNGVPITTLLGGEPILSGLVQKPLPTLLLEGQPLMSASTLANIRESLLSLGNQTVPISMSPSYDARPSYPDLTSALADEKKRSADYAKRLHALDRELLTLRQENEALKRTVAGLQNPELLAGSDTEIVQLKAELQQAQARIGRLERRVIAASLNVPTKPYDWGDDSKTFPEDGEGPSPSA